MVGGFLVGAGGGLGMIVFVAVVFIMVGVVAIVLFFLVGGVVVEVVVDGVFLFFVVVAVDVIVAVDVFVDVFVVVVVDVVVVDAALAVTVGAKVTVFLFLWYCPLHHSMALEWRPIKLAMIHVCQVSFVCS